MIRTDRRMGICITLLVLLLVFIWGNSLLPAAVSQAFSNWVGLLFGLKPTPYNPDVQGISLLRKAAHFTEFAALGLCLSWLAGMLRKKAPWAFVWGAAAACIDETIQMFVPGRGPGILDVAIDSCGVLTGMILLCFGHTYIKRKTMNHLEDN